MKKKMNKTGMEKLASVRIERSAYEMALAYKIETGISMTRFISGLISDHISKIKAAKRYSEKYSS